MKNKNGFTLIEIIAVVVILAVIITLSVPAVMQISKRTKQKMYESKIDIILNAAKLYGDDHRDEIINDCSLGSGCLNITAQDLLSEGYLTKDNVDESGNPIIVDPRYDKNINDFAIVIYLKNNRVYAKDANLFDINKYTVTGSGTLYFNLEELKEGITYKITSDKTISLIQIIDKEGITTISSNVKDETITPYGDLSGMSICIKKGTGLSCSKWVKTIDDIIDYNISITEVN